MHLRNGWKRGLEDNPVPHGVQLDSSGGGVCLGLGSIQEFAGKRSLFSTQNSN